MSASRYCGSVEAAYTAWVCVIVTEISVLVVCMFGINSGLQRVPVAVIIIHFVPVDLKVRLFRLL